MNDNLFVRLWFFPSTDNILKHAWYRTEADGVSFSILCSFVHLFFEWGMIHSASVALCQNAIQQTHSQLTLNLSSTQSNLSIFHLIIVFCLKSLNFEKSLPPWFLVEVYFIPTNCCLLDPMFQDKQENFHVSLGAGRWCYFLFRAKNECWK